MATKSNSVEKIVVFGFLSVLVAWFLLGALRAGAIYVSAPQKPILPNDITTLEIASGTIVRADVSDTANLNPASIGTTTQAFFVNNDAQTFVGVKTFSSIPVTTGGDCSNATDLCDKNYVDASSGKVTFSAIAANDILGGDVVGIASTTAAGADINTNATGQTQSLGDNGPSYRQAAQSFTATANVVIASTTIDIKTSGSPTDNIIIEMVSPNGNIPSGYVLASSTLLNANIPNVQTKIAVPFTRSYAVPAGSTVWFVIRRSGAQDATNFFVLRDQETSSYAGGNAASNNGTSWSAIALTDLTMILGGANFDEGRAYSVSNDWAAAASSTIGIASNTAARGTSVTVLTGGTITRYAGLTTGKTSYVGSGRINATTTKEATGIAIGRAVSTTTVNVAPWLGYPTPITF